MQILEIDRATRTLGEAQGYRGLPIRDQHTEHGNVMVSEWAPSDDEIAAMIEGAPIRLAVYGTQHPPVKLEVAA